MSKPSLLILAAGMGSRYGGFKQIDPVGPNGEFIIDYSVYDALRAGFGKIIMVIRPELEEPIREHFRQTLGGDLNLTFAFQETNDLPEGFSTLAGRHKPWGTGHAIWSARHVIDTPFAVINADDFYGAGSYRVVNDFLVQGHPDKFCMCGFELAKTLSYHGSVSRGICRVDSDGCLAEVIEHVRIEPDAAFGARSLNQDGAWTGLAPDSIASMNLWGFNPAVMDLLEEQFREFLTVQGNNPKSEFFIPAVVDMAVKQGKIRCRILATNEQWFGMTYKEDRESAAAVVRGLTADRVYPSSLR